MDGGEGDHSLSLVSVGSVIGGLREARETILSSVLANSSRSFASRSFCNRRTAMVSSLIEACTMALEMLRRLGLGEGVLKGSVFLSIFTFVFWTRPNG